MKNGEVQNGREILADMMLRAYMQLCKKEERELFYEQLTEEQVADLNKAATRAMLRLGMGGDDLEQKGEGVERMMGMNPGDYEEDLQKLGRENKKLREELERMKARLLDAYAESTQARKEAEEMRQEAKTATEIVAARNEDIKRLSDERGEKLATVKENTAKNLLANRWFVDEIKNIARREIERAGLRAKWGDGEEWN